MCISNNYITKLFRIMYAFIDVYKIEKKLYNEYYMNIIKF